jgi:hypothetical protein
MLDNALGCPAVDTLHIVTDSPHLFRFASVGRTRVLTAIPPAQPDELAPGWALPAYAARIAGEMEMLDPGPVLVLNVRNLSLDASLIEQAVSLFQVSGKTALASVVSPADNPCQFVTPMRIQDIGHLLFFEVEPEGQEGFADFPGSTAVLTKPFIHNWEATPPGPLPHFCVSGTAGLTPSGLWLAGHELSRAGSEPLWFRVNAFTARLGYPRTLLQETWGPLAPPGTALRGANLLRSSGDSLVAAAADEGEPAVRVSLRIPGAQSPAGTLALLPLRVGDVSPPRVVNLQIPDAAEAFAVVPDAAGPDGLLYSFVVPVERNAADFLKPYTPAPDMWRFESAENICVNSKTGQKIVGRQSFPDVVEMDASLLVVDSRDLTRLDALLDDLGALELFTIPDSPFNDDRLTVSLFQAKEAARGHDA